MRALKRLLLGLTILAAVCTSIVFISCKRLPPKRLPTKEAPGPRNLTPGLSEALTSVAERHPHGQIVTLWELPDSDEEAKNLAGLIATAFEAGGWQVLRYKVSARPIQGLRCLYNPEGQQKLANDLLSVFQEKGLLIECLPKHDPTIDIILVVGTKS